MFENPRRGRQARNFTTNAPKILDLKLSSEQILSRELPLGAPELWWRSCKTVTCFLLVALLPKTLTLAKTILQAMQGTLMEKFCITSISPNNLQLPLVTQGVNVYVISHLWSVILQTQGFLWNHLHQTLWMLNQFLKIHSIDSLL